MTTIGAPLYCGSAGFPSPSGTGSRRRSRDRSAARALRSVPRSLEHLFGTAAGIVTPGDLLRSASLYTLGRLAWPCPPDPPNPMRTHSRPSGVRLWYPERYRVADPPPGDVADATRRTRRSGGGRAAASTATAEATLLLDALAAQQLEPVDAFTLVAADGAHSPGRTRSSGSDADEPAPVLVDVPVAAGEGVVLLVQEGDYFSWSFPVAPADAGAATTRGTPRATPAAAAPTSGTARFEVRLGEDPRPPAPGFSAARSVAGWPTASPPTCSASPPASSRGGRSRCSSATSAAAWS